MLNTIQQDVAGVVVLYNPDSTTFDKVKTYISQVGSLYIVDNSDVKEPMLIRSFIAHRNTIYIDNKGNKGIAYALNKGVEAAMQHGYKWLLTMDQDTMLPRDAVELLYKFASSSSYFKVGIVSPRHFKPTDVLHECEFEEVKFTMTSGNLLNLEAIRRIGGFIDDLFVDHVDHEFCFRLGRAGYKIFESNTIEINHRLGKQITKTLFGKKIEVKGHSAFRLYYIVRNGLIVSKMYPEQKAFAKHVRKTILLELVKSVLFYDQKLACIREIWRGYITHKLDLKAVNAKAE